MAHEFLDRLRGRIPCAAERIEALMLNRLALGPIAASLIVAAALALRLWNLPFGLPDWYHPDEPRKARIVLGMARGDLDPGYFYHPSFMLYASALALRVGHAAGTNLDERSAAIAGRCTVALLGAATVLLTYLMGCRVGGPAVGLVAALLLAVAPLHVVCSHYLKEDVPMTFWGAGTFLASLAIVRRGRRFDYAVAGFLAGLAASTKYTGLLFLGLPLLAHRERPTVEADRKHLLPVLVAWALGFLSLTPYALLRIVTFAEGVGHGIGAVCTGIAGIAVWPLPYAWTFHLRYSILPGFGLVPTLLAGWGLLLSLRGAAVGSRLLAVTTLVLYAVFETSPYKPPPNFDRYVVPMLPFMAVLAAQACMDLRGRLAARIALPWTVLPLLVALAAGGPLWKTLRIDAAMASDTRQAVRQWLLENACGKQRILLEGALNAGGVMEPVYTPRLPDHCRATYRYSIARVGSGIEEFDIVVASSFMYERFLWLVPEGDENRRFYEKFFAENQPEVEFSPRYGSYGFHNPVIRVYELRSERLR